MGSYRLSLQARNQVRDIDRFTKQCFGAYKLKPITRVWSARLGFFLIFQRWASRPTSY